MTNYNQISPKVALPESDVICWWSGGITSAIACWLAVQWFGKDKCRLVFIDTKNEHPDTYRFMLDCEELYGKPIERIWNAEYENIEAVWYSYNSLNVANGAICSDRLKRQVRLKFQSVNVYSYQVFGFDLKEIGRAQQMKLNYPNANPIFPLITEMFTKERCISFFKKFGIEIPEAYKLGLNNNNCLGTGCVQGGIGYWQLLRKLMPEKFDKMALIEHELTNRRGSPVTMLKDQGKNGGLVFLKPHPQYPHIKDISLMKGRPPRNLMDCNGMCGLDLSTTSEDISELNLQVS